MTALPKSRLAWLPFLLVLVLFTAGAFFIGRRSTGPGRPPDPRQTRSEGGGAKEAHDPASGTPNEPGAGSESAGVVRLEGANLKLAHLQVEPVSQRTLQARLAVTGSVEPNLGGVVKVTPRVAGKVTAVRTNVGETVRAGQVLATLTSTELAQAQAANRQATAQIGVARNDLRRQRELARLGAFGRPEIEAARREAITAQGEVRVIQQEVLAARNGVAEAESEKASLEGDAASAEADVVSARSAVAEAEGQVKSLQAVLSQTQTAVKVAQSKFNRADLLLKDQLVSRQDWEQAQADVLHAQAAVDAARANVSGGLSKVETARAQLDAAQAKVRAARSRVQQAGAKIQGTRARQQQAGASLEAATQRAAITDQALARAERVFQGGYLTSKEIVAAEATLRQAQLDRQAALDSIGLLGGTPGGGNVLAITAPLGGRVTERLVTLGETVSPDKVLFTVVNLTSVWVQLNVYQRDLPQVRLGHAVVVTADTAPGRTFSGTVSHVSDQVDEATRTVKVRCVVRNAGDVLKPQTFVRGTIATAGRMQALAVPKDAVQQVEGRTVVFVPGDEEGEFQVRPVEVGDRFGSLVEIRTGLKAGESVVTKNAFVVKSQAMKEQLGEDTD